MGEFGITNILDSITDKCGYFTRFSFKAKFCEKYDNNRISDEGHP